MSNNKKQRNKQKNNTIYKKVNNKTILQRIFSWPSIAFFSSLFIGGGFSLMTTTRLLVVDLFFIIGVLLPLCKFLTWEEVRDHNKKKLIARLSIIFSILVLCGLITFNHYFYKITHKEGIIMNDVTFTNNETGLSAPKDAPIKMTDAHFNNNKKAMDIRDK